jgi:hypothetical protein
LSVSVPACLSGGNQRWPPSDDKPLSSSLDNSCLTAMYNIVVEETLGDDGIQRYICMCIPTCLHDVYVPMYHHKKCDANKRDETWL